MLVLGHLEPQAVFNYFEQICSVPHGSGNCKAIADLIENFAKEHSLDYTRDEVDNIIIRKPGTTGYENSPAVILQGHMDMVCEKEPSCKKDMATEPIELLIYENTVTADGTTLGADNGIAVAMAMAILASDDIPHPPIEAIITTDEETGMLGAVAIDLSETKAKTMINIDSEEEGVFTVSCAGGNIAKCEVPVSYEDFDGRFYCIEISGLKGGHSGIKINKGRANSNVLMGRVLYELKKVCNIRIASIFGGDKDNAIPVKTVAVIAADNPIALEVCCDMEKILSDEFKTTDPNLRMIMEKTDAIPTLDKISTDKIITMLQCMPNGVLAMSADIAGLVQTSLNMGVVKICKDKFVSTFCVRSSVSSQKDMVVNKLSNMMECIGGTIDISGDYPAWEYKKESRLRDLFVEVFTEQYGYAPKIEAIHAGVECGLFAGKIEGLDCISIGPELRAIHTPRESMSISSVERTWKLILEVLKRLK